ncbi:actin-interacting protein 1-like isoform X1 [Limulus polyphemus]|uniref:Actin-interacting protein 1-like isoform X1 n=1 Tax=Limulus polyphemus TaxID=6850 RepID=A0ABM1TFN0_LIMPO|nr:actin-interacting protein 1-like isoform X1 [Limulus polyphemus]
MSFKNRNIFATLPRTQRGMPLVLGGDPKGKNILYANGNSIIIRDIENPAVADVYTEHSTQTTVAKYSPSGFYIASADVSGKVRIWDTTQKEHLLKNEFQPFVGEVKDLAWSFDNQRIIVVGEGKERFGHVIMAETGTSVGEIAGHSKLINSCDFRPCRPFRIITGSEDNSVQIYEGPPFKFKHTLTDHSRFVQSVRYSPNGELFATAGFDGKLFLYNAKEYTQVGEVGTPAHNGGIYGVSWSPDNTKLLTASGDKTCKLWDVATMSLISEFTFGKEVLDQQVSCLWQGNYLLSVSLSGFINYLDVNNSSKPLRIIKGHNKSITSLGLSADKNTLYTGSHDGYVTFWDVATGDNDRVEGPGHGNQVQDMASGADSLYTCGIDDTVRAIDLATNRYSALAVKTDSQPKGIAVAESNILVIAGYSDITVMDQGQKKTCMPVEYEPNCVSAHPMEADVAVGGHKDHKVHIYLLNGYTLSHKTSLNEHRGAITDVAYSPDGSFLAACDANRKVILYRALTYELAHNLDWCFHTARVNSISWTPDSQHLATGSLDTGIIIWSVEEPNKHINIKSKEHPQSQITRLTFLDNNTLVSTGQDSNIKIWEITYK